MSMAISAAPPVHFRTVKDLFDCVRRNIHRLPESVDVVAGVPRSGILAASAVSLTLNKPMVELQALLQGRLQTTFSRREGLALPRDLSALRVLIVDDSIFEGNALRAVREAVKLCSWSERACYGAIYGLCSAYSDADFVLEICPAPRVFEWNLMNSAALGYCCVDLDGVLCVDPSEEENDDGARYIEFVRNAKLINAPQYEINSIVTSRLEKYRGHTEYWLKSNGIQYRHLFMLGLCTAEERRHLGLHAKFKAQVYSAKHDCLLFIESETYQAREIQQRTGKLTLGYKDMMLFSEPNLATARNVIRHKVGKVVPAWCKPLIKTVIGTRRGTIRPGWP